MTWTPADTTIAHVIVRGGELRMRCPACGHDRTWTDQDLVDRFLRAIDARITDLEGRLICSQRNCGKQLAKANSFGGRVTVKWRNTSQMAHEMQQILADREAELREWAKAAATTEAGSYAAARKRT